MPSRPPPRLVVRRHDDTGHRRRWWWWLGSAWLVSLLLTSLLVTLLARQVVPAVHDRKQVRALMAQVEDLKQQLANGQRAAQVNDVATRDLHGTLVQREEELSGLRADLGFYARLVGGDTQRQGIKLQEVKLQPITGSAGWNLSLSLTQNAKRGDQTTGTAVVSVEGLRKDKVVTLDWSALGNTSQTGGLPFAFTYFQQLHGSIVLPPDFRPTRLRIVARTADGESASRDVAWGDALNGTITTAKGDPDAQP
jgi:hypothetical protein